MLLYNMEKEKEYNWISVVMHLEKIFLCILQKIIWKNEDVILLIGL
jgi:hypothetical protein